MKLSELMWLAGLLEGEGTFLRGPPSAPGQPRIRVDMTDHDVVQRAATLMGVSAQGPFQDKHKKWKPHFAATLRGSRAVALMRRLRPHMGKRRKKQIDAAVNTLVLTKQPKLRPAQIRRIKKLLAQGLGDREVARRTGRAHSFVSKVRRGVIYATEGG